MTEAQVREIQIRDESIEEFIETHISYVLLTEKHAYKVKKAIRFSFLDFSTMEQRKYFCEQELRLNQRLAKEMYLQVLPIKEEGNHFLIHSIKGVTVDHALQMRRMNNEKEMHRMLQQNKVTHVHIDKIAEILVVFHQSLPGIRNALDVFSLKEIFNDIRSVEKILVRDYETSYHNLIDKVITFSNQFIDRNINLLEERIKRGLIKDCHGDLHTRNIFLESEPVIFDCIEFNAAFREIDILYELAFFCMDLDAEEQAALSNHFMKRYRSLYPEVMKKPEDELLFLYYKLYRANVRAKVTLLKIDQADDAREKSLFIEDARKYLNLLQSYLEVLRSDPLADVGNVL